MSTKKHNNYINSSSRTIRKKANISFKKLIILLLIILLIIFIFTLFNKNHSKEATSNPTEFINSQINNEKHISGLDAIKILGIDIQSSDTASILDISLNNTSNNIVNSSKIHLYLYDNSGTIILGSSLKLPEIQPNSQTKVNLICSDNINNVSDYKIVLE